MGVTPCPACGQATFCARTVRGSVGTWDARRIDRHDLGRVDRRALIGLFVIGSDGMRAARESDPGPYWRLHEGVCERPGVLAKARAGG